MSANLAHRATVADFVEKHEHLPSRRHDILSWVMLAVVALGDFIAFSVVLMKVFGQESMFVGLGLTLAASFASILLMHEAGSRARAIRANSSAHGWKPVVLLTLAWLALGLAAFYVRIDREMGEGASSRFSSGTAATDTAALRSLTDVLPPTLLLLVIFIAGGVGAYVVGFRSYNPARSAYFRLRRAARKAEQRYEEARVDTLKGDVDVSHLKKQLDALDARHAAEVEAARRSADRLALQARVWLFEGAADKSRDRLRAISEEAAGLDETVATLQSTLDHRRSNTELESLIESSGAQARQLKQLARLELAKGTADPAATSGLFRDDN